MSTDEDIPGELRITCIRGALLILCEGLPEEKRPEAERRVLLRLAALYDELRAEQPEWLRRMLL